jgi:hypothetical protein
MMAQILLAWLKLLALDGDLAKAEPKNPALPRPARRRPAGARRAPPPLEDRRELAEAIMRARQRICALPDTS